MNVLFLYLTGFSLTGGIEKFNRSFLKALHELSVDGYMDADACSSYDSKPDEKYFPRKRFKGFGGNRVVFTIYAIFAALRYDTLIVGHMNLAVIAVLVKRLKPSIRLVLITHGIEAWKTHTGIRLRLLQMADHILSVSQFTKQQILDLNPGIDADKINVFHNTIDPYFAVPKQFDKPAYLMQRYGLSEAVKVLLTVTRLSFSEKYKGYDNTITVLPEVAASVGQIRYFICGNPEKQEQKRIKELIIYKKAAAYVQMPGFIKDEELIDHYLLSDLFVMPSKKEGFGIVFIEALACGRPVIAGSKDGSADALLQGELGTLIDPDNTKELESAIIQNLQTGNTTPLDMQEKVLQHFGFKQYKQRLQHYLVG